jgi:hypothetical protein
MARSHGKILSSVWRDDDWLKLSANAQRTYILLLSQPKMTLCGTLDLAERRWARMAHDTSVDDINRGLLELQTDGFVIADGITEELAVRSFVRHDLNTGRMNGNLAKGFWRSWLGLESDVLRSVIVSEVPADLWEKLEEHAPPEALDLWEELR